MKRLVVHTRDENGRESAWATDPMEKEAAEAERTRIEEEHAAAGDENRWIRVGDYSIQSKHLTVIRLEEPLTPADFGGEEDEPFFRRDMRF